MTSKFKYQWYQEIYDSFSAIIAEAEGYGKKLGLNKLPNDIGLYAGVRPDREISPITFSTPL